MRVNLVVGRHQVADAVSREREGGGTRSVSEQYSRWCCGMLEAAQCQQQRRGVTVNGRRVMSAR